VLGYCTNDDEVLPILPEYYDMFGLSHNPAELITPALTKEITNAYFTVKVYTGQSKAVSAQEAYSPKKAF
jgi:hypothetical protein